MEKTISITAISSVSPLGSNENIIWQNLPPKGKYEFKVVNFSDRGGSNFKAQIEFAGQIFDYEVNGIVNNVVFSTGTALFEDTLYIYYGAADKCIACASVSLKELLKELLLNKVDYES